MAAPASSKFQLAREEFAWTTCLMTKTATFLPVLIALTGAVSTADPALTIYNGGFAVVRDTVPLELNAGITSVKYAGATAKLEPDSVILRDPTGKTPFHILEQSYRNDPATQSFLLSLFEGKVIEFETETDDGGPAVVSGKVVRSGHQAIQPDDSTPAMEPIIEVAGKLRFGLPGTPIFPSLGDDTILKPTLVWQVQAAAPAKLAAELAYVTQGFTWKADYNLVLPEQGDVGDIAGWVTVQNQSGTSFTNARLKLMAGEVEKVAPPSTPREEAMAVTTRVFEEPASEGPSEKPFDEYHLYTLPRPTTLRDAETKQVEFTRAAGVKTSRIYSFNGAGEVHIMPMGFNSEPGPAYGEKPRVFTELEFKNSAENRLGIPLPGGRLRVYRRDGEQLEFVGEQNIEHTPKDELVRVKLGAAFDLVGERQQVDFQSDEGRKMADESFEIKVRNRSERPVE
ncbi:MAG TPA: hypothetical protein VF614_09625, partial [Chthoniobacteraceae bacterium]